MAAIAGNADKLSYNMSEAQFRIGYNTDMDGVLTQYICRFEAPMGAEEIEAFVKSYNLGLPNVDWGYEDGISTSFFIRTKKRLTKGALDALEQKIKEKGFKIIGGHGVVRVTISQADLESFPFLGKAPTDG